MGAINPKQEKSNLEFTDDEEIPPNNGYVLSGHFLPPEVVTLILGFLDPILPGRLVCKAWLNLIDSPALWQDKVLREVPGATSRIFHKELIWLDYYYLCQKKPHKKNLIRNGSGEDDLLHWQIKDNRGACRLQVEKEPTGSDPFPCGLKQCFVSSYDWCSAEQIVNLAHLGLTENFMKHVQPNIYVEEWYAGRFDCGFAYNLKVTLLSESWDIIDSFEFRTYGDAGQTEWTPVRHCFSNYDKGVAMILFHHKGIDSHYWKGHYGCKMTGAKLFVTLPGWEEYIN